MAGARVRYFHGGTPGLAVGDIVVPRCELPVDVFDRVASSIEDPADATRTYITENMKVARGFALRYANSPTPNAREGWLYEVLPDPNAAVEPDPDFPRGG
ncbi:hypothetical protein [Nocardia fluminea]|uniref:hypothetical protein n=1 Tax=Nocardia fluminea TaxID=134984 RepID=UPI00364F5124